MRISKDSRKSCPEKNHWVGKFPSLLFLFKVTFVSLLKSPSTSEQKLVIVSCKYSARQKGCKIYKPLTRCPHGSLLESYSLTNASCESVHVLLALELVVFGQHSRMFHKETVALSFDFTKLLPLSKTSKEGCSVNGSFSMKRVGKLNTLRR